MIVMKFGGSSLESAGAIEQAASIVQHHLNQNPVIVVSAMGKTTDRLLDAAHCAARGDTFGVFQQTEALRRLHFGETRNLLGHRAEPFLHESIAPLFRELQALLAELAEGLRFTAAVQDQILSYGERLSSLIVAEVFRHLGIHAAQVDARKVIVTDDQFTRAAPLRWETYTRLRRSVALVAKDRVVVMGGFIGSTLDGMTTTLGRGGSDLTATLVGAGIAADEVQIWSDVDGMLTSDPRVLSGGPRIREISYEETEELARRGAKVLCPDSIAPAVRQRIPIVIRNSRRPEVEGTRVVARTQAAPGVVKCVTSKAGMTIVRLRAAKAGLLSSISGGLADLFASERISIDLIQPEERGVSFAVPNSPALPGILRKIDESVEIAVEEESAAIWLVGDSIAQGDAILARAGKALQGVQVRLTSHGSSPLSLGFAVPETQLRAAMQALHSEFFTAPHAAIFAEPQFAPVRATHAAHAVSRGYPAARPQIAPAR